MADKKISQLSAAITPLTGTELVPVVQSGTTVRTNVNDLGAAVGYTPAGTGAVATTVQTKLRESVSVKDFGAVGNGIADDTAAMQAAHSTGSLVHYPTGNYKFSTITIPSGGMIGDGTGNTILTSTDTTTANLITFTGNFTGFTGANAHNNGVFEGFTITVLPAQKSVGAAIQIAPTGGGYSHSPFFTNVTTNYAPIGIDVLASEFLKIIGCDFLGYTIAGVKIANSYNPDMGDGVITDCNFSTNTAIGPYGIYHLSSGGLKVIGNKILGGQYSYYMGYTASSSTSDLQLIGNSMELAYTAAVVFARTSGSSTFSNVVISGNQIALMPAGIASGDTSGFLTAINISGNAINLNSSGAYPNIYCVALNNVFEAYIGNNLLHLNGAGTNTGISLTNCTQTKIGTNVYIGCSTGQAIATTGSTYYVQQDYQAGTVSTSTTGYAAYGTMFVSALTSVTFPVAFNVAPALSDITITATNINGTVSAGLVAATTTGFTFYAFTSITGIAAGFSWKVSGIL